MKWKIAIFLLICSGLLLTGCGIKEQSKTNNELSVASFDKMLKENGITFKKLDNDNPRDGVKKLYYYYFDDETMLHLYVFDVKSELYKQAQKNNMINAVDVDAKIGLTLNKNLGISFQGNSNYKNFITEKFRKLK